VFDRNSDGYISKAELYHTLKELGVNLSLEELNSKMREADSNQDGRIDYAGEWSMSMSKTFIGGAVCRQFESEALATEEMLD